MTSCENDIAIKNDLDAGDLCRGRQSFTDQRRRPEASYDRVGRADVVIAEIY